MHLNFFQENLWYWLWHGHAEMWNMWHVGCHFPLWQAWQTCLLSSPLGLDAASVFPILDPGGHYYLELAKEGAESTAQHGGGRKCLWTCTHLGLSLNNSLNPSFFIFRLGHYYLLPVRWLWEYLWDIKYPSWPIKCGFLSLFSSLWDISLKTQWAFS